MNLEEYRQMLMAQYLGASLQADAFTAAFKITNYLQNLFGEGAMSSSFIPVYSRLLEHGEDAEADRVAGAVASLLVLAVAVLVLIGVVATPALIPLIAPGFTGERRELTIRLTRILFPGAGVFVISAWCLGVLNSHRKFLLPYLAPVLWNVVMIGALLVAGPRQTASAARACSNTCPDRRGPGRADRFRCDPRVGIGRGCDSSISRAGADDAELDRTLAACSGTAIAARAQGADELQSDPCEPRRRADQQLYRQLARELPAQGNGCDVRLCVDDRAAAGEPVRHGGVRRRASRNVARARDGGRDRGAAQR